MNFGQAVQSSLGQYAGFAGPARRSEYWWFALFLAIVDIIAGIVDSAINSSIPGIVVTLALLLPSLAVGFRRCTTPAGPRGGS